MSAPAVSVVLPVRDGEEFLALALGSILGQTHRDLELVVVDDGSTDDSGEIADRAAAADPRVRVLRLPGASGISGALNAGIEQSRGTWIARMDADDVAVRHRIERQLAVATTRNEAVCWGTWAYLFDRVPEPRGPVARAGPVTVADFERLRDSGRSFDLIHSTILLRKDLLEQVGGYDARFDGAEDVELFDRLSEHGPLLALPEPLLHYRMRLDSFGARRFSTGQEIHRFVAARQRSRRDGTPLPTIEEFRVREAAAPTAVRAFRRMRSQGEWLAWRGDARLARGQWVVGVVLKLVAAALDPGVARRIARRLLGRGAVR